MLGHDAWLTLRAFLAAARARRRPVLFDGCCCAGGATKGYQRAGWLVVGMDIEDQPNYCGDLFLKGDVIAFLRAFALQGNPGFTAMHGSPPCQGKSVMSKSWNGKADEWPDLIPEMRELFEEIGLPWVIENVVGAELIDPIKLCGSMFDLPVERHRLFESNVELTAPRCNHARQRELWPEGFPALRSGRSKPARVVGIYGTGGGDAKDIERWKWAMGIDWMQTKHELAESLPPAFTEFIGRQLMAYINEETIAA